MAGQFALRLSLIIFATVLLRRLLAGSAFEDTLFSALCLAVVFVSVGLLLGEIARRVVFETAQKEFEQWMERQNVSAAVSTDEQ